MQLFSAREQAQLDVYGLWAVLRNQLTTDDNFAFNRTLNRIKDSISHLDVAGSETEAALARVRVCVAVLHLEASGCCREGLRQAACEQTLPRVQDSC